MRPGHGEVLIAEGDPEVDDEQRALIDAFRKQLDEGMWAAVPTTVGGRRQAEMVREGRLAELIAIEDQTEIVLRHASDEFLDQVRALVSG